MNKSFYLKNFEADQRPQKQAENKEKLNQKSNHLFIENTKRPKKGGGDQKRITEFSSPPSLHK